MMLPMQGACFIPPFPGHKELLHKSCCLYKDVGGCHKHRITTRLQHTLLKTKPSHKSYLHTCLQPLLPQGIFSSPWDQQTVFQLTLIGIESYLNDMLEDCQQIVQPSISGSCKMLRMRNYCLLKLVGKN